MTVLIISDSFLPEGNAAAVHMSELQKYYDATGTKTIVATSAQGELDIGSKNLKQIIRVPNRWKRSSNYGHRVFGEIICAILIGTLLRFSSQRRDIERVIVYSPTIFWAITLKIMNIEADKVSLIIRDIFPFWLLNAELLKKSSLRYKALDMVAKMQFKAASSIFVQAKSDIALLKQEYHVELSKLFILQTWMNKAKFKDVNELNELIAKDKKNLLWLGNMGIAQNRNFVIEMLKNVIIKNIDINLNLVGLKHNDRKYLEESFDCLTQDQRQRVRITDYLTHENCTQLALRSDLGIFSLGDQTTPGNVPGKFITYIMAGLPVFGVCAEESNIRSIVLNNFLGNCVRDKCAFAAADELIETLKYFKDEAAIDHYFAMNHSTENAANMLIRGRLND